MKKYIFILFVILCVSPLFAGVSFNYAEADKVVYKPGDVAKFTLNLKDYATEEITCNTYIYTDINRKELINTQQVSMEANIDTDIITEWTVSEGLEWGCTAEMEIIPGDSQKVSAFIQFAVGKNRAYKYGYWGMVCNRGLLTEEQAIVNVRDCLKQGHYSAMEFFSWNPSCWEDLAPETHEWISGQTGYIETKKNIKTMIDTAHQCGINAFSYHQANSWGYGGEEYLRLHPEWWNYDRHGKPFADLNVYDMSILDNTYQFITDRENWKDSGVHPHWIWWSTGNLVYPGMVDFYFSEMKKSKEMFGWDGFRSDGFARMQDTYDADGNVVKADPKYTDYPTWLRYVRQRMKEEMGEETTFHHNSGSVAYPLEKTSPEVIMANAEDDSYVLWEGATYAYNKGHDLNDMRNFARYGHKEVEVTRKAGGERYVMMGLGTNEYIQAIVTAFGGRVCGIVNVPMDPPARYYPATYLSYTFRFGEFFWNNKLQHIENADQIISVDKNVYWDTLVQKLEKDGKTYYMVHLINAPESFSASDPVPAPVQNVTVSLNTDRKVRAYATSPDFGYDNSFVYAQNSTGSITVPEIRQWTCVIFECE